jgi:hypothetical protein
MNAGAIRAFFIINYRLSIFNYFLLPAFVLFSTSLRRTLVLFVLYSALVSQILNHKF